MSIKTVTQYFTVLSLSVGAALFVKWSILALYRIPTLSMSPTLLPGDIVMVNKSAYGFKITPVSKGYWASAPNRGDLILFKLNEFSRTFYIKRVIALPGEDVEIKLGQVFVNKKPFSYVSLSLGQRSLFSEYSEGFEGEEWKILRSEEFDKKNFGPVKVPDGQYFVLGDNRDSSEDSRVWGGIGQNLINGQVFRVAVSLSAEGFLRTDRMMLSVNSK